MKVRFYKFYYNLDCTSDFTLTDVLNSSAFDNQKDSIISGSKVMQNKYAPFLKQRMADKNTRFHRKKYESNVNLEHDFRYA